MNANVLFSSAKQDWTTPKWLFDRLNAEFHFTLDAAATPENALCDRYFTEADDALTQPWSGRVFLNPPYARQAPNFVAKAWEECYERGRAEVVACLVAARTDTQMWHQYAMRGAEVRFIEGRLRFGDGRGTAPFPSAVLVFDWRKVHPSVFSTISQKP